MSTARILTWHNPADKIWGFHVHQELPEQNFRKALVIQQEAKNRFTEKDFRIDADDAMSPGYGPHLDYMWELRVESKQNNLFEKLGYAVSWMAINRFGLSGYIHPLMHDPNLPVFESLRMEGELNQSNTIWFGYKVPQHQDFFFHPPLDELNNIVDTRTTRVISQTKRNELVELGKAELVGNIFRHPENTIINGFHIHMDYDDEKESTALAVFKEFVSYLHSQDLIPTSTRIYKPGENGPHVQAGWEVKFETASPDVYKRLGTAIAWLMCNRQEMPVFMHPVTWREGDHVEELTAHEDYAFFIDKLPKLDLTFFSKRIAKTAEVAAPLMRK